MKYILILCVLFLSACSIKNYEQTQAKLITMKTKLIKFSDLGYIRNSGEALELELFTVGKSFFKLSIDSFICTDKGCTSKSVFNDKYLNASYPETLLQNILLSSPIYEGKNRVQTQSGFEQEISDENVEIIYKVSQTQTYFKDKKNNILFKIKEIR